MTTAAATLPNPFDLFSGEAAGNGQADNGESEATTTIAELPPLAVAESRPAPEPTPAKATRARRQPLYLDIETVPDESRQHLFDLPPLPVPAVYATENEGPAPSELIKETVEEVKAAIAKAQAGGKKLPRVILEAAVGVEQKRPKPRKGVVDLFGDMISTIDGEAAVIQEATEAQRKTMSVTPEFCRIVSIGWAVGSAPAMSMVVGQQTADGRATITEEMLLEKAWDLISGCGPIIGFNILGFDLPVIFTRSILLGVDSTKKIDRKAWGPDVVDLMDARFGFKSKPIGLKTLAKLLGIPVPAEGVDGSQVAELFASDPVKVGEYVRSDIAVTRELHKKFAGFFC